MANSFQYSIPDGRKETARVDITWWDSLGLGEGAHDPYWITSASPEKQVWLGYSAHDNQLWFSKISANHWHSNSIQFSFEHRGPAPAGWSGDPETLPKNNNGNDNGHLGYRDWNGTNHYLVINSLDIPTGRDHAAPPTVSVLPA